MSYIVDVDPVVFDAASKVFGDDMANGIDSAWSQLTSTLSSTAQMAGSDTAGTNWSKSYDPAAQDTIGIMGDLRNACLTIAALLERTGFNHGMAESHSDPTGSVPTPADTTTYTLGAPTSGVCVMGHDVPLAAGGSGSEPTGWSIVEHAVGYLWPNGDPGKLRGAAGAWSRAASALEAVTYYVPEATTAISYQESPEIDDAVAVCTSMSGHINDTASNCRSLSQSCNQLASYIDTAHQNIENELKSFIEWTAGTEIIGGIISVFTAGAAEAPTQAVEASRIATTAARIAKFIETMIDAVNGVLETIGAAVTRVTEIASKLKVILGARLSEAATSLAARLPILGDDTGAIAFGRLGWDGSLTDAQLLRQNYKNGKLAESLVPGAGNTTRIVVNSSGKYRIPDILDDEAYELGEVKNVKYQSYSRQLRDYVSWAAKQDPPYTVNLIVRAGDGTRLTGPLKQAIASGDIKLLKVLPK